MSALERTDEALMADLCRGDHQALETLVFRHQNDVFRFCVHYLKDAERARDLTQECFVRVYSARERFDAERKFKPWMLCIARNLCLNEIKRKRAVPMQSLEEYASSARDTSGVLDRNSVDGPDGLLMAQERQAAMAALLDGLPDDVRELIVLRFFEELPAKEIAEIVGGTEGAVRTRLHRALKTLRRRCLHIRDNT